MVRITDSDRKAILKKYPDAWIISTKHHAFLTGYEDSFAFRLLLHLRGEDQQKPTPARKDGRQPRNEQFNRKPRQG